MSQEKVLKTLESLGLSQSDAQVYVFLGKKGPHKAIDITTVLRMPKQQLYVILKNLQSKGIVNASLERPAKFSAVPFEKVLDLFVRARMEEAQRIQQGKNEILSDWQSIAVGETADKSAKFTVLEGRNYVYSKLKQMVEETKDQLMIISTIPGLFRADQFGLIDTALNRASESKIGIRFLTELSQQNMGALKSLLDRTRKTRVSFEGRIPELGLKLFTRIVIRDNDEAIFFITPETEIAKEEVETCLWTNCRSLVNSFSAVFEDLWGNSTDIQKRITEAKTGKPMTRTCVFTNVKEARQRYDEALDAANKELVILTSSTSLSSIRKKLELVNRQAQKHLSVKIMAPITNENLQAARELSKTCEVRHVSANYLETTIVDGKQVFQFKGQPQAFENSKVFPQDGNTYYSDDLGQVERTKNMLDSLWQSARTPPILKAGLVSAPSTLYVAPVSDSEYSVSNPNSPYRKMSVFVEEKPKAVTEEEVLSKIINGKKYPAKNWPKENLRFYGSAADALIHPPEYLNLPPIFVFAYSWNKQSSFGAEDLIVFYLWLETSKGFSDSCGAVITDNLKAVKMRSSFAAGTPAEKNVRLLKKDQMQISIHGNTAFVGWTVPIPLLPPRYVLPPAAILIEGYGKLKSSVTYFRTKSGVNMTFEGNGYDAFVTFFHPKSRYAGPGTDGLIGRDEIATYSIDQKPSPNLERLNHK